MKPTSVVASFSIFRSGALQCPSIISSTTSTNRMTKGRTGDLVVIDKYELPTEWKPIPIGSITGVRPALAVGPAVRPEPWSYNVAHRNTQTTEQRQCPTDSSSYLATEKTTPHIGLEETIIEPSTSRTIRSPSDAREIKGFHARCGHLLLIRPRRRLSCGCSVHCHRLTLGLPPPWHPHTLPDYLDTSPNRRDASLPLITH